MVHQRQQEPSAGLANLLLTAVAGLALLGLLDGPGRAAAQPVATNGSPDCPAAEAGYGAADERTATGASDAAGAATIRPFSAGEQLEYRARFGRLGEIGHAIMRVAGPVSTREHSALLLIFDLEGRRGLIRLEDRTRSWICESSLVSLRYLKEERNPIGARNELVEVFPAERRWESANGETGRSPTGRPLDELSFIYFLRTLALEPGATYDLDRHFDPGRNPVRVTVVRRERVAVPAGEFDAVLVEMRVRDTGRFNGEGVLRLHLTDDHRRIPVRIESALPLVGAVVLSLERASR